MKSKYEYIYHHLPVTLQNLLISLYGMKEEVIRYRGNYRNYCDTIKPHLSFSKGELRAFQERHLKTIVSEAKKNVPFYRKNLAQKGLPPIDRLTLSNLHELPLLEKMSIREQPADFINVSFNKRQLLTVHTTGSTGTPLDIVCTPDIRQRNYAFFSRFLESVGIDPHGSRATIGGRIVVHHNRKKPPYWRYSYFQKSLLFSSYHLTDDNMIQYIKALGQFKPSYIDTYPSSIFTLAEFAKKNRVNVSNVTKAIVTSAETLFPTQRECIESQFGVPVFDQYGAAEMCIFVAQCTQGNYHIHSDYGIVEFIREDGSPAESGEEAEIVCTGFINPVMPLIRYRIGDRGVLSDENCACGSGFPILRQLLGRTDDVIQTPDGRKVGRLSPVLKGFPVKEAQYVQECIDEVIVRIVRGENYTVETDREIIGELRKRLGMVITITIQHVDTIERGKGGKLRSVVSLLR